MDETQRTLKRETVFDGRLLKLDVLDVEIEPGTIVKREVVRHAGAVAVLARLPDGRFVFVRQFRIAVAQPLLEIMAGTLEPGEAPEACARRELQEETGYRAERLVKLGEVYNAPGYCSEKLHLFFAELAPDPGAQNCDEGEDVEVVTLTVSEIEALLARGELNDAKSLAAWALFRAQEEK
ncbi:MAG: NUDIX hydrolase [Kiritimatiellae bacterium]|nr:NUDIX hydrolase [Kiritimatiellia bacterium]